MGGIIPAGAGLTASRRGRAAGRWDHPRGCGAHSGNHLIEQICSGSSPRVRGSLFCVFIRAGNCGIIPAGAGLTPAMPRPNQPYRDHPRGCGAHCLTVICQRRGSGSSPRVRGSQVKVSSKCFNPGIIPAGAGLTASRRGRAAGRWDHPRGCGAHSRRATTIRWRSGSSPRVRGSPVLPPNVKGTRGIIPAGAGLTIPIMPIGLARLDHPRGCGAHNNASSNGFTV